MYTGVKQFNGSDEWCAYTQIQGIRAIIYTADNAKECACAYDHYIKLVGLSGKRTAKLNDVGMDHNFIQLLNNLIAIGGPIVRKVAEAQLARIEELTAEGGK